MNSKLLKLDDDRITNLSDDLLIHILSFLPTKFAVATSILSTRWRNLSDFLPDIDLADHNSLPVDNLDEICNASDLFIQFVRKVIMVRTLPTLRHIRKFHLSFVFPYDDETVYQLIRMLLVHDIRQLKLSVTTRKFDAAFPREIFECKSLEVLNLGNDLFLHVPKESFLLPNLKVLKLCSINIDGYFSVSDLLSGCPVLEDLGLSYNHFMGYEIEISHPLLKYLELRGREDEYCVICNTPNLQKIKYRSDNAVDFVVEDMKSLVHAHVDWTNTFTQKYQIENHEFEDLKLDSQLGAEFINKLHYASYFYLADSPINALYFSDIALTTLHNLTVLELGAAYLSGWLVLPKLLESSPNLKSLVFCEGFIDIDSTTRDVAYCLPDNVPRCFIGSLEEIKVRYFNGHKCELELVEYFLKSVAGLKMMMIGVQVSSVAPLEIAREQSPVNPGGKPPDWLAPTCERLCAVPKCSEACQIMLTWMESPEKYCQKML